MTEAARDPETTLAAPRRRHGERLPALFFVVSILAGVGLAAVYALGGQAQAEGALLAVALCGFGGGLVLWAKRFMNTGQESEPRGQMSSTEEDVEAFKADFDVGEYQLERRSLLTKLMLGAGAALGLAALFPIQSLGPRPSSTSTRSPFQKGTRLVDEEGQPLTPASLKEDGVLTVFPEGDLDDEFAQTMLIRLDPTKDFQPRAGREDWTVDNLVAYSKVCTHAGCPVGLYERQFGTLLCPCHQSTFDVYDGARPVFGPAAVSLPQLPLTLDDEGHVVASGPFSGPVGPEYWDQNLLWEDDGE
jgi:ubiquinol-cytochrome c reductase iron-sulfur subunit